MWAAKAAGGAVGVGASGEGGAAAASADATAGDEEGGRLVEGSSTTLEPLRAYEQTKRRIPSWCHNEHR